MSLEKLLHTLYGLVDFKLESAKLFIALLVRLSQWNPLVVSLLQATFHILEGSNSQVYPLLSTLIQLFIY